MPGNVVFSKGARKRRMSCPLRQVSSKRARKLRKRGESVWWSREHHALVWEMRR